MLEGVLVKECMFPEVGHELNDRGWKGAGESIDATDMVSRSGVTGSRYGFVVLMNVTVESVREERAISRRWKPPTVLWNVQPDGIILECVLVGIEPLQRVLVP
mgnify:CR=1 FL=1